MSWPGHITYESKWEANILNYLHQINTKWIYIFSMTIRNTSPSTCSKLFTLSLYSYQLMTNPKQQNGQWIILHVSTLGHKQNFELICDANCNQLHPKVPLSKHDTWRHHQITSPYFTPLNSFRNSHQVFLNSVIMKQFFSI